MNWTPILSMSDRRGGSAVEAIEGIARDIGTRKFGVGKRQNAFEEALLYGYLAAARNDQGWASRAIECLNADIDQAGNIGGSLALHGGLCGLGWTVEHLARLFRETSLSDHEDSSPGQPADIEEEDLTAEISTAVLRKIERVGAGSVYDLISGLVGFGVYFLERLPRPAAVQGIRAIFERLEEMAEPTDQGTTWHTGVEQLPQWQVEQCPNGYYNLGVAHGIPGAIHLLGQISRTKIVERERVNRLLEGAVTWLLAQQRSCGSHSRFPCWVAPRQHDTDSRLAWCYGDLGILAVMIPTARRSGRKDWQEFSGNLLDHCLAWPPGEAGVVDAPLCHGAAGVAHIFNRIYQDTGDHRCRDAAIFWFERVLAMRQAGTGVGGFCALTQPDPDGAEIWEANPAFLDGSIGIALALLAALTPLEPNWDRLLLVSERPLQPQL